MAAAARTVEAEPGDRDLDRDAAADLRSVRVAHVDRNDLGSVRYRDVPAVRLGGHYQPGPVETVRRAQPALGEPRAVAAVTPQHAVRATAPSPGSPPPRP